MNTSIEAVAAVKELVYTGSCRVDKSTQSEEGLAEILETMSILGIEVSVNSFSLETEFPQGGERNSPSLQEAEAKAGFEQIWKNEMKAEVNVEEEIQVKNLDLKVKDELCVEENVQHVQRKGFPCNFEGCKAKLASKDSLNGHIRYVHKKKELFKCNQCLKEFKRRANLRRHIDALHTKLKPYHCEEAGCSKEFSSKDWLKRHIKAHHLKEKPHACIQPGCGEAFGQKITLKRHMMKVHNFEKPCACPEKNCGQKFEESRYLKNHLRSVHGAERLACDVGNCTRTFIWSSGLHEHKRRKHT